MFLAPANKLLPLSSDGWIVVSPNDTGTFVASLSTPSTLWVIATESWGTSCGWFVWLLFRPLGRLTLHFPLSPTVTSLIVTPGTVTLILAPGCPVPVNSLSVEATVGTSILPFGFIVVL